MTDIETELDESAGERKPRKSRKRNEERRIFLYRMIDGNPKEQGAFPETAIGTPLERRLPVFAKELFGKGEYRAEIRKPNGHFERAFDFSIATEPDRAEKEKQNVVEIEPEEFDDELEDFSFDAKDGQMSATEVENLLLKERLRRLDDEVLRHKSGNQSETQTLIAALEESRREQRELMMMMLAQSQKPQQDATTQAMGILEKSLGIVTRAKAISEEIAPQEAGSSNSTYLGDAAKLVDSLGKINVSQYLSLLFNRPATVPPARPEAAQRRAKPKASDGNQQGELSDLLARVKNKQEGEKK